MDPVQTMPNNEALVRSVFTAAEWLTYYKNIWVRNLVARTIDVQNDIALKAKTPDMEVMLDDKRVGTVSERLEFRKTIVQDALDLLESIKTIESLEGGIETRWTPEALAIAPDMLPQEETPASADAPADAPADEPAPAEPAPAEPAAEGETPSPEAAV